jgi:hypothetical protein
MPSTIYFKVTEDLSPDKKGIHVNSELDLDDFDKLIKTKYGLKNLDICDFPEDEDDTEYYHFKVVDKKLFSYFSLRWS